MPVITRQCFESAFQTNNDKVLFYRLVISEGTLQFGTNYKAETAAWVWLVLQSSFF